MIYRYLPKAVANSDYMKARDKMAFAQYLAGIAFNNASLGYVHAMAHQLGGYYNLPHGVCNTILLPYVEEFNLIGKLKRPSKPSATQPSGRHPCKPADIGCQAGGFQCHGGECYEGCLCTYQSLQSRQGTNCGDLSACL